MTTARVGQRREWGKGEWGKGAWDKDEKGARSTHERPSRLRLNSACTSVDHLLTRQERRSPNVRKILRGVNGYCASGGKSGTPQWARGGKRQEPFFRG